MVKLRAGRETTDGRLDWMPPPDERHRQLYPMLAPEQVYDFPAPVPVVLGIPWYEAFEPGQLIERRGKFGRAEHWVREGNLGRERGGHCLVLEPEHPDRRDTTDWWRFYDQGAEGACVGFGWSRCMSLLNRRRYAARQFYYEVQRGDPWPGGAYDGADPRYDGTSTRHGGDVLRDRGHLPIVRGRERGWSPEEGVKAVRWAETVEQIHTALGTGADGAVWLNSWGERAYPHRVHVPDSVLQRIVVQEQGEAAVPVDR